MSSSFTKAVYDYLTARPNQWVHSSTLEQIGGRNGWRTRVSNVRTLMKDRGIGDPDEPIPNKQIRKHMNGREWVDSYYCFKPAPPKDVLEGIEAQPGARL